MTSRDSRPQWRKVTADVVEIARELEIEVEPENVTELLQCHDKTFKDEELLLTDEQRKWFLEMESIPSEGAVKMVEMTTEDLKYYIDLADEASSGFLRGLTSILKEVLMWIKCYQTALHATEKSFVKERVS